MRKKKKDPSLFFMTFIGELVAVTTKLKITESMQNEEGSTELIMPMAIEAFLLDEDNLYYYLGKEPDQVDQAIKKVMVSHIEIVQSKHPYDELLDDFPTPTDQENIN